MPKQQICKKKNGASKKSTTLPPEADRLTLWEQAVAFLDRVGTRLRPEQFKRFIAHLINYKRKGKHSRFQKEELFQRLNTMLQDHHDLSAELTKFVPKAFRRQAKDCVKVAFERKYEQVVHGDTKGMNALIAMADGSRDLTKLVVGLYQKSSKETRHLIQKTAGACNARLVLTELIGCLRGIPVEEEGDKCCICLDKVGTNGGLATVHCECRAKCCRDCILDVCAKLENRCPLCRQKFLRISWLSAEGEKDIMVYQKQQRVHNDDVTPPTISQGVLARFEGIRPDPASQANTLHAIRIATSMLRGVDPQDILFVPIPADFLETPFDFLEATFNVSREHIIADVLGNIRGEFEYRNIAAIIFNHPYTPPSNHPSWPAS